MSEKKPGGENFSNLVPPERLEKKRKEKKEKAQQIKELSAWMDLNDMKIAEMAMAIMTAQRGMDFRGKKAAIAMEYEALKKTISEEDAIETLIGILNDSREEDWKKRPAFFNAAMKLLKEKIPD